jgi:hypothetical protein
MSLGDGAMVATSLPRLVVSYQVRLYSCRMLPLGKWKCGGGVQCCQVTPPLGEVPSVARRRGSELRQGSWYRKTPSGPSGHLPEGRGLSSLPQGAQRVRVASLIVHPDLVS